MTNPAPWLMVLPAHLLPAGIGTLAANATGIFVEAADSDAEGRWISWQDVVDCVASTAQLRSDVARLNAELATARRLLDDAPVPFEDDVLQPWYDAVCDYLETV
jgi:hypothetical protein